MTLELRSGTFGILLLVEDFPFYIDKPIKFSQHNAATSRSSEVNYTRAGIGAVKLRMERWEVGCYLPLRLFDIFERS